ncbi:general secretion pathway protein GspK [bacterium]|nr:general secretion pathway protein GspK [candidate division CSSED10-310 bacterium]
MKREPELKWRDESGIALLLVLFVVSLLMVLAAEFMFTTHMEVDVTQNFKENLEGYYYALAGFQYALTEVIGQYNLTYLAPGGQIGFYRNWFHEPEGQKPEEGDPVDWPSCPNRENIRIGEGAFDYVITDEEGRLNINYIQATQGAASDTRRVFRELLLATGVEEGDHPDIITDSIIDWIDRNDLHLLNGAESDWYEHNYAEMGFSEPYACKNDRFDTLDELLMVRGMAPEILYGSDSIYSRQDPDAPNYAGIAPYITIYGFHRKVNKITAPPLLVRIMDPEKADEFLQDRQQAKKYSSKSKTFRIEVRGYRAGSRTDHRIMAVVRQTQRSKSGGGAEILYWNDNATGYGDGLKAFSGYDSGDRIFQVVQ